MGVLLTCECECVFKDCTLSICLLLTIHDRNSKSPSPLMRKQCLHTVTPVTTWHHWPTTPSGETSLYFSTPLAKTIPLLSFPPFFRSGKNDRKDKWEMFVLVGVVPRDGSVNLNTHTVSKLQGCVRAWGNTHWWLLGWDHAVCFSGHTHTHKQARTHTCILVGMYEGMRWRTYKTWMKSHTQHNTYCENSHSLYRVSSDTPRLISHQLSLRSQCKLMSTMLDMTGRRIKHKVSSSRPNLCPMKPVRCQ